MQETVYEKDGTKSEDYRYFYDSYGQRIGRKVITSSTENVYPYRRTWNFRQRMTSEEILLPEDKLDRYTYQYNKKGEVISGTEQLEDSPKRSLFIDFIGTRKETGRYESNMWMIFRSCMRKENMFTTKNKSSIKKYGMKKIINPWKNMEGYNCFGCSPDNEAGVRMEFYEDGDEVVSIWKPRPEYQDG